MWGPSTCILCVGALLCSTLTTTLALAVETGARPLITPPPLAPRLLYERDQITWAYISGDSNSPLTCPPGYTTSRDLGNEIQACCNSLQCADDWQTCIPYGGQCTDGLDCSFMYTSWLSCTQQSPGCITYNSITGPNDAYPVKSFTCGPSNQVVLALGEPGGAAASTTAVTNIFGGLATSYAMSSNLPSLNVLTSVAASTSSVSTSSPVPFADTSMVSSLHSTSPESLPAATSTSSSSETGPGTGSTTSSGGSSSSSSSHLDTGTIVGIVAGVVSLLAIFVAIWLKWPKTITRFLSCGTCTTVNDDSYQQPGYHGIPMRYIPQRNEPQYHFNDTIHYQ